MTDPKIRLIHAYTRDDPPAPGELVAIRVNNGAVVVGTGFHAPAHQPNPDDALVTPLSSSKPQPKENP